MLWSSTADNLLDGPPAAFDVILVGDLFYDKPIAGRCFDWLSAAKSDVLIGDPGRTYLPRDGLVKVIEYAVPVTRDLEDAEIKNSAVWRLARFQKCNVTLMSLSTIEGLKVIFIFSSAL